MKPALTAASVLTPLIALIGLTAPKLWGERGSNSSQDYAHQGVTVEQYDKSMNLPGIPMLKDRCVSSGRSNECKFLINQEVLWGAGFCEDSREEVDARLQRENIALYINGIEVPEEVQDIGYEVHQRDYAPHCHSWLVKLSNWTSGAKVELMTTSNNTLIDKTTVYVE